MFSLKLIEMTVLTHPLPKPIYGEDISHFDRKSIFMPDSIGTQYTIVMAPHLLATVECCILSQS